MAYCCGTQKEGKPLYMGSLILSFYWFLTWSERENIRKQGLVGCHSLSLRLGKYFSLRHYRYIVNQTNIFIGHILTILLIAFVFIREVIKLTAFAGLRYMAKVVIIESTVIFTRVEFQTMITYKTGAMICKASCGEESSCHILVSLKVRGNCPIG